MSWYIEYPADDSTPYQLFEWLGPVLQKRLVTLCACVNAIGMYLPCDIWNIVVEMLIRPKKPTLPMLKWISKNMLKDVINNPIFMARNRATAMSVLLSRRADFVYYVEEISSGSILNGCIAVGIIDQPAKIMIDERVVEPKYTNHVTLALEFTTNKNIKPQILKFNRDSKIFPINAYEKHPKLFFHGVKSVKMLLAICDSENIWKIERESKMTRLELSTPDEIQPVHEFDICHGDTETNDRQDLTGDEFDQFMGWKS